MDQPKTILLVDYENIQNIDLSSIKEENIEIKIFVGQTQNKIPFNLVQTAQRFGQRLEWIKIDGIGNNALDFYLAFYLGRLFQNTEGETFLILSKDKGFDPLVRYINKNQVNCYRIQSLVEFFEEQNAIDSNNNLVLEVIEKLSKVEKNKRPRTKKTLQQYLKSLLNKKKLSEQEINTLIETLFIQDKISQGINRLTYNF